LFLLPTFLVISWTLGKKDLWRNDGLPFNRELKYSKFISGNPSNSTIEIRRKTFAARRLNKSPRFTLDLNQPVVTIFKYPKILHIREFADSNATPDQTYFDVCCGNLRPDTDAALSPM